MGFIPLTWASEIGITAGVLVGGFANPHKASDPVIGAALGAASNATGDGYPAALKKLNDALINEGWVIPVTEQYAYVGYNAKKVATPAFPGLDDYPLLDVAPARGLTSPARQAAASTAAAWRTAAAAAATPDSRRDVTCSPTSPAGSPSPSPPSWRRAW